MSQVIRFGSSSTPPPGSGILTLTGDIGGAVGPDGVGNIDVITANSTVIFAGNAGTNTQLLDFGLNNLILGSDGSTITSGTDNVALGDDALNAVTSGLANIAIGVDALGSVTNGSSNIGIGFEAGIDVTGNNNTILGFAALSNASNANSNTVIGYQAMSNTTGGNNNVILGTGSGTAYTGTESNNVLLNNPGLLGENGALRLGSTGVGAGQQSIAYIAAVNGVTVPNPALMVVIDTVTEQLGTMAVPSVSGLTLVETANATDQFSIVGSTSTIDYLQDNNVWGSTLPSLTTGIRNIGIGNNVLNATTSATDNHAFGHNALQLATTGGHNVAIGEFTMDALVGGVNNVAVGGVCLTDLVNGSGNTAIGYWALRFVTQSQNIGIGQQAGTGYVAGTENENIVIGYAGVSGESNALHIGTSGITGAGNIHLDQAFIGGIFGVTGGVSAIPVLVDSADQLCTIVSSERYKNSIQDMPASPVLELKPRAFKYNKDGRDSIGLIAEEVEKVMPYLVSYNAEGKPESVKYHELPILLLAEIQKLRKEIDEIKMKL